MTAILADRPGPGQPVDPRAGHDPGQGTLEELQMRFQQHCTRARKVDADFEKHLFRASRDGFRLHIVDNDNSSEEVQNTLDALLKLAPLPPMVLESDGVYFQGSADARYGRAFADGMNTGREQPWVIVEAPPAPQPEQVDWTADPRWGDDDDPAGTLEELQALVLRRLAEMVGPVGPELHGQHFRYERDSHRLGEVLDWPSDFDNSVYARGIDPVMDALFGKGWDEDTDENGETIWDRLGCYDNMRAGAKAAETYPWTLYQRRATLADRAQRPRRGPSWYVEGLWPRGSKCTLIAPPKAGKTTLVANVVRSLVDGTPMLGRFAVTPLAAGETVYLADLELTEDMTTDGLLEQGIENVDRIIVENYRGRSRDLDVRDQEVRAKLADELRALKVRVIVLDCLGPVLAALGVRPSDPARPYLEALDALVLESGAKELLVVHHAGHKSDRASGSIDFGAWPDAIWTLTRSGDKRYLSAEGRRGIAIADSPLDYDSSTAHLTIGDAEPRPQRTGQGRGPVVRDLTTEDARVLAAVAAVMAAGKQPTGNQIEQAAPMARGRVREALARLTDTGVLAKATGGRGAIYTPGTAPNA